MKKIFILAALLPCLIIFSGFIKWVDFDVTGAELNRANRLHKETGVSTCEILALWGIKVKDIDDIDKHRENKWFKRLFESYSAVLDGIICSDSGEVIGHHPIAKGFWHTGGDDFGNSRTFGFKRRHLGHDLFGGVGTPIIAVEGGTVTEIGWNRYGGWRVGIRSECTKRYYYYAHLRKNKPFAAGLELGSVVAAGDVIGYLGRTGYSRKENVNMSNAKPHLHFGMQLIFDPSQEDGSGEIWIDVYPICKFLEKHKMKVIKDEATKEYTSQRDG